MKKLPVAVPAFFMVLIWCVAVLAAPMYQQTESVEKSSDHTIVTVSGSDAASDGPDIVLIDTNNNTNAASGDGHTVIEIESDGKTGEGKEIVNVGSQSGDGKDNKKTDHKIITVSGGDTVSVVGEAKDARAGYENYGGYYTLWDGNADGYDDYYNYLNENVYNYTEEDGNAEASFVPAAVSSGDAQAVGYYDYGDGYYDDGYYDSGYYDGAYYDGVGHISRGFNGTVILVALGIGLIVAFTHYASTKHSYENAGIGVVYDLKDNALLKLAGNGVIDRQIDQRSSIDRGFYGRSSGSVYASPSSGSLSAGRPGGVQVHVGGPGQRPGQMGQPGQRPGQPGQRPNAPNMPNRPGKR